MEIHFLKQIFAEGCMGEMPLDVPSIQKIPGFWKIGCGIPSHGEILYCAGKESVA